MGASVSAVWVEMVQSTRSNASSKFWASSLGLILYLRREFKAHLTLTSVAIASPQHICKPDPMLSGQKRRKSETEGTTCEARGLSDQRGFLEELYDGRKDRAAITGLARALTLFSLRLLHSTLTSFSSHLTGVFHTEKAFFARQVRLVPTAHPCCEASNAKAVRKQGEVRGCEDER